LLTLLAAAVGVFIVLFVAAFLIGKLFESKKTRKRIMIGTITVYLTAFIGYFGFIVVVLSGNINR